jgi:predicted alpha/beta hydrolase family esterase
LGEIARHVESNNSDEIYLIGHSLGWPAILRYLEYTQMKNIAWAILVSSPSEKNENKKIDTFLDTEFDFEKIRSSCNTFVIIHGDNDPLVPLSNAQFLSEELWGGLIMIKNGWHLNGSAGCFKLPECLVAFYQMMK